MNSNTKLPEIRFNGFCSDWKMYPLAKFISSLDAGVSVNSGDRAAHENELGILKTSCVTNGFFEPYENKVVIKQKEISRLKEPVLENTIIISRMNTPALVGANAYIGKSYPNYFLPDRLWAAKPISTANLKFIANILGSCKGRLALSELATGTSGSMKNISKPAVLRLELNVPGQEEQTQIVSYFQKLDSLIDQHQQKHDNLINIKKAMLEKMFPKPGETTPEIRFKGFVGDWKENELKNVVDFFSGLTYSPNDIRSSGTLVLRSSNVKNGQLIQTDNVYVNPEVVNCSNVAEGDIIVVVRNGSRSLIGKHAQVTSSMENTVIGAFMTGIRSNQPEFLNALLDTNMFTLEVEKNLGATINQITNGTFKSMVFLFPSADEQQKIGRYFYSLDVLINQHQQHITKLNNIKQACLNKMFV